MYLKNTNCDVSVKTKLGEAYGYMLNQKKYLRTFLTDGEVPIDNNASERAIRGFCIGKKNWQMIDTISGVRSSAIIYSIAETAKANNLKPYGYFEYLLSVIPEHMEDTDTSFLEDLLFSFVYCKRTIFSSSHFLIVSSPSIADIHFSGSSHLA